MSNSFAAAPAATLFTVLCGERGPSPSVFVCSSSSSSESSMAFFVATSASRMLQLSSKMMDCDGVSCGTWLVKTSSKFSVAS